MTFQKLQTRNGNLLQLADDGVFDVIVHGCNCFNEMGAGIAKQIKSHYPEAYEVDQKTTKGDISKLGTYTIAEHNGLIIVNAYTEYKYGRGKQVDYEAIQQVFHRIVRDFSDKKIGIPKIGAGYGGGRWKIIHDIIYKEMKETGKTNNITVVIYKSNNR